MRYRISKYIQFLQLEEYLSMQPDKTAMTERLLIRDISTDRSFLINSTIEIFIKKFAVPKTFTKVTEEIATEINASAENVKKCIAPFFNYSKYRRFIVPENYMEEVLQSAPLFNADYILDKYKIKAFIDSNGDIDVYKAIDLETNNMVVIKLLRQPAKQDAEELQREYNFLMTLNKTGVTPQGYTFKINNEYAYFVQEFVEGISLPQFIRRKKDSGRKLVLVIAEEIVKAFGKIHAAGIIHGDIHPSNIILTNDSKIKVLDFGLAVQQELEKEQVVNFGGAYFFMPPERIKKTTLSKFIRKPDFYSDVFQLGVVLYMLLYDAYPFNGLTWEELATEIKEKQIEFPLKSQYSFLVPEWIKNIISTCVAKEPAKRFSDAQELCVAFSKNRIHNASKIRPAAKV
jgi:predicted Ser/Thr protein kinase